MILTTPTQIPINNYKEDVILKPGMVVHAYSLSTPKAKTETVFMSILDNIETQPTYEIKHMSSCLFRYLSDKPKELLLQR